MTDASNRRQKALRVIRHYGGDKGNDLLEFIRREGGLMKVATDDQLEAFAMHTVEQVRARTRWNRRNQQRAGVENG